MQFFKLAGAFAAGSGGQGRKRTADENVDLLAAKSEAFNKGLRGRAFFYVVNASGGTFTAMAVQKDAAVFLQQLPLQGASHEYKSSVSCVYGGIGRKADGYPCGGDFSPCCL